MSLATLPETKALVARNALRSLFSKSYFDICVVQQLCELAEVSTNSPAYRALRSLHCANYADLDPELREQLPRLVNECLRPPRMVAVDVAMRGVEFPG